MLLEPVCAVVQFDESVRTEQPSYQAAGNPAGNPGTLRCARPQGHLMQHKPREQNQCLFVHPGTKLFQSIPAYSDLWHPLQICLRLASQRGLRAKGPWMSISCFLCFQSCKVNWTVDLNQPSFRAKQFLWTFVIILAQTYWLGRYKRRNLRNLWIVQKSPRHDSSWILSKTERFCVKLLRVLNWVFVANRNHTRASTQRQSMAALAESRKSLVEAPMKQVSMSSSPASCPPQVPFF